MRKLAKWIATWIAYWRAAPGESCANPYYNPFHPNVARVLVWSQRYRDPSGWLPDLELQVFKPYRMRIVFIPR